MNWTERAVVTEKHETARDPQIVYDYYETCGE